MLYQQQQEEEEQVMDWKRKKGSTVVGGGHDDHHQIQSNNNNKVEEEQRLEIIDLSSMSLEALPNPSLNLASICKLDLSNNNLQVIPESLTARLLNLVVFDVHSNQLKTLPNSIGCLSKLKVLNVAGNLLATLPKTIENCRCKRDKEKDWPKIANIPYVEINFKLIYEPLAADDEETS